MGGEKEEAVSGTNGHSGEQSQGAVGKHKNEAMREKGELRDFVFNFCVKK